MNSYCWLLAGVCIFYSMKLFCLQSDIIGYILALILHERVMSIVSIPSLGLITLNQYTIINHLSCKKIKL